MMNEKRDLDNYIVQLVESMRESAQNLPGPHVKSEFDEKSLPEELKMFTYAERYIRGKAKPLAVITSIDTQAIPPGNKMTNAQTIFLYDEMTRLLSAFGFYADFPEGLPVEQKYSLLRQSWDDKFLYTGDDITCFEFCDYEPSRCPFPESFCRCKDLDDFDGFDDFDNGESIF
ncbi:hypothetical protein [Rhodohalobacter sp. 8-1]|uniref:hypothetical protein n=1 Tax=Rhodohalobacter sp. 8-1 TaxID=3131972 RepID=UPI0030EEB1A7